MTLFRPFPKAPESPSSDSWAPYLLDMARHHLETARDYRLNPFLSSDRQTVNHYLQLAADYRRMYRMEIS